MAVPIVNRRRTLHCFGQVKSLDMPPSNSALVDGVNSEQADQYRPKSQTLNFELQTRNSAQRHGEDPEEADQHRPKLPDLHERSRGHDDGRRVHAQVIRPSAQESSILWYFGSIEDPLHKNPRYFGFRV